MTKHAIAVQLGTWDMVISKRLAENGYATEGRSAANRTRLARAGTEERQRITKAAHDAVRGMKRSHGDLVSRAVGKERNAKPGSIAEAELARLLSERGIDFVAQKAVDKYNLDFALGNVAVEVNGRSRKPTYHASITERTKYLLDLGWNIVFVWAGANYPVLPGAADYVASYHEQAGSDPSMRGQYRVIRRDGKLLASGCADDDEFPGVLAAVPGTWARPRD